MLSQRNKLIILIVGFLLILVILVLTIFDLWPGKDGDPNQADQEPDLSFLEQGNFSGQGLVFDSSNQEDFAAFGGVVEDTSLVTPEETEAKDLAEFFIVRYGTYSGDSLFAYIDDLKPFMTSDFFNFVSANQQSQSGSGYFSVKTEIAGAELISMSDSGELAEFNFVVNREEFSANRGEESYGQEVKVSLKKEAGVWKVDGVFWGNRVSSN